MVAPFVVLVFFVNSNAYHGKCFIKHVFDMDGLHQLKWGVTILSMTLDSIIACQQRVWLREANRGHCNVYLTRSPLGLMVYPNFDFLQFSSSTFNFAAVSGCFTYLFLDLRSGTHNAGIEDISERDVGVLVVVRSLEDLVETFEHIRAQCFRP